MRRINGASLADVGLQTLVFLHLLTIDLYTLTCC